MTDTYEMFEVALTPTDPNMQWFYLFIFCFLCMVSNQDISCQKTSGMSFY